MTYLSPFALLWLSLDQGFMQHNRANLPTKYSNCVVRKRPWKAVNRGPGSANFELYNIVDDHGETTDLAEKHPYKVKSLASETEA